ncbi:translesion DNA synthesis-associated protein ImuA [Propionivibrio sp.]|uniref:translesion DNA synthesis-associated protein ImuA n=1 Tax=Propionivibrio sp. TaxID=2212460 RepID=UPI0025E15F1C|nr:translesion DNA synthesis-associated protein ImuA [Propionivibrio sp.]MBK7356673.1 translesion DNA synthesis-associated protein ImuA [Propionivibrio sp.]MBK8401086.1 translesion DNA synthesis-associated protein ImuA [Propionivibrio sp.]MBK8744253.1 translesion DNA synthesis-associated protein ImuA [Propionivibrio sp.]MBK8894860.1 translesion DNA synthesis-associated protein ImuA [Propionivibrio sp.]MBL0208826.1 translesion DNA synthesis-associated protein ImuA [Propionivibrio sp.]
MNAAVALDDVLARPDVWRGNQFVGGFARANSLSVASGFAALDAELPGGGWPRGALTEILLDGSGLGECSLLLPALLQIQQEGRWGMLVAPPHRAHGPAWVCAGVNLAQLVIVSPAQARDVLWAAEQALSNTALGVVLCWAASADARQLRRLQVAAASGNSAMFLFRPVRAAQSSSAAPLRLLLRSGECGALDLKLLKRRGAPCSRTLTLDVPRSKHWCDPYEFTRKAPVACPPSALPAARSEPSPVLA